MISQRLKTQQFVTNKNSTSLYKRNLKGTDDRQTLTQTPDDRDCGDSHNKPEIFSGFLTLRLRFPSENVIGSSENRPEEV
ncbi:MAG: hypothetical protein RID09_25720 [Coleofasciculus sp. G1-WW12-02]|uniref:hypothetical protein n=1 Tax=Coleofasciculus sp. G1-WW12-02 TaxID=3068483 RepID=UPI0032FB1CF8